MASLIRAVHAQTPACVAPRQGARRTRRKNYNIFQDALQGDASQKASIVEQRAQQRGEVTL
jgi:hypothetical protein